MPLPSDPAEMELTIREAVTDVLRSVAAGSWRLHSRTRYVDSESDLLDLVTVEPDEEDADGVREEKVVFVEFAGFRESDDACLGQTKLLLSYTLEFKHSLIERADGSNSHDDFAAFVMRARAALNNARSLGFDSGQVWHSMLQTKVATRVINEDDVYKHAGEFSLEVEVNL